MIHRLIKYAVGALAAGALLLTAVMFFQKEPVPGVVYLVIGLIFTLFLHCLYAPDPLLEWLKAGGLRGGPAVYEGAPVTPDSVAVRFHGVASFLIWSGKYQSPLLLAGRGKVAPTGAFYTLLTLATGWWGFPFGLLWTPVALFNNLRGGTRVKLRDLQASL
jgi:hypothetical protein